MFLPFIEDVPSALIHSFVFSAVAWLAYMVVKHLIPKKWYRATLYTAIGVLLIITWHWIWSIAQLFHSNPITGNHFLIPLQKNEVPWFGIIVGEEIQRISGIVISITYVTALLWQFIFFLKDAYTVRKLNTLPYQSPQSSIINALKKSAIQIRLRRLPIIRFVGKRIGPLTTSFFRPIILYPVASVNALSLEETQSILLHELTHIKYKDFHIGLVVRMLSIIMVFNPWARLLAKEIRFYQEVACDQTVLKHLDQRTYLNALVKVADNQSIKMAMNAQPSLLGRIRLIYGEEKMGLLKGLGKRWTYLAALPLLYFIAYIPSQHSYKATTNASTIQINKVSSYHLAPSHLPLYTQIANPSPQPQKKIVDNQQAGKTKKVDTKKSSPSNYEMLAAMLSESNQPREPNKQLTSPFELTAVAKSNEEVLYKEKLIKVITQGGKWISNHKYTLPNTSAFEKLTPEQASSIYEAQQSSIAYIENSLKEKLYHKYTTAQLEQLAQSVESTIVTLLYLGYQIDEFESNVIQ